MTGPGRIVVLNGAPRSGKSSIARALQDRPGAAWLNLGVDISMTMLPEGLRPGIGLRPGGERPDLEPIVVRLYAALYDSIAAHARQGFDVVADLGHHDFYSQPRHILPDCARRLAGLPAYLVGVTCPLAVILARRAAAPDAGLVRYAIMEDGTVPAPVLRWQEAVHEPGLYDLGLDTAQLSPAECADRIRVLLADPPPGPTAFERLAQMEG